MRNLINKLVEEQLAHITYEYLFFWTAFRIVVTCAILVALIALVAMGLCNKKKEEDPKEYFF